MTLQKKICSNIILIKQKIKIIIKTIEIMDFGYINETKNKCVSNYKNKLPFSVNYK